MPQPAYTFNTFGCMKKCSLVQAYSDGADQVAYIKYFIYYQVFYFKVIF